MTDHLAGATAGLDRVLQMAENFVDTPVYPEVSAVTGKMHGWKTMLDHAEELGVAPVVFEELIDAAEQQRETLGQVHSYAAQRAFRKGEKRPSNRRSSGERSRGRRPRSPSDSPRSSADGTPRKLPVTRTASR